MTDAITVPTPGHGEQHVVGILLGVQRGDALLKPGDVCLDGEVLGGSGLELDARASTST